MTSAARTAGSAPTTTPSCCWTRPAASESSRCSRSARLQTASWMRRWGSGSPGADAMTYEVWDMETANQVGAFQLEADARAFLSDMLRLNGADTVKALSV